MARCTSALGGAREPRGHDVEAAGLGDERLNAHRRPARRRSRASRPAIAAGTSRLPAITAPVTIAASAMLNTGQICRSMKSTTWPVKRSPRVRRSVRLPSAPPSTSPSASGGDRTRVPEGRHDDQHRDHHGGRREEPGRVLPEAERTAGVRREPEREHPGDDLDRVAGQPLFGPDLREAVEREDEACGGEEPERTATPCAVHGPYRRDLRLRVLDAEVDVGQRLDARLLDRLAAALAGSVAAVVDALERAVDLAQQVADVVLDRQVLLALEGGRAGVGRLVVEAHVAGELGLARREGFLFDRGELVAELGALGVEATLQIADLLGRELGLRPWSAKGSRTGPLGRICRRSEALREGLGGRRRKAPRTRRSATV